MYMEERQLTAMADARSAGLHYIADTDPGITRRRAGKGWSYRDPDGDLIRDRPTLERIRLIVIPPAWRVVWISPDPRGHIQATGRDERGRKQYRYHARWSAARGETKYERTVAFAESLPLLRARVAADLAAPGLSRDKVIATIVSLLEATLIRIGNQTYAKENKSYGLTTLRDRHVEVKGERVMFSFRGKSGVEHEIELRDRRLAKIVRRCQDLPGQTLFQWVDDDGVRHKIGSDEVNAYLREASGADFTAKDVRTWAGTVLAAHELAHFEHPWQSETEAKRNVVAAIKAVSERLGNTQAVCRKCYIHPSIITSYEHGTVVEFPVDVLEDSATGMKQGELDPVEAAVLAFLKADNASTVRAA